MPSGGYRTGAGRKENSGMYGEKTISKRLPVSLVPWVEEVLKAWPHPAPLGSKGSGTQPLPFYEARISAGFPSPATDYVENALDLNDLLVTNPPATFFLRVSGDSMIKAGIQDHDILVVDRAVPPKSGRIVIAALNGELTVKRLELTSQGMQLCPDNDRYQPIVITEDMDFHIWGVVTAVIHQFK